MCGKLSELLVKYPLSCGQPNYEYLQHFLLWVGPIDRYENGCARVSFHPKVFTGLSIVSSHAENIGTQLIAS